MAIKIRQLEAMRAVVAGRTVTRAAEILGITQPAMSRLLAQLEREVGFKLFVRRGQRLTLAGDGEVFFREAQQCLASVEHLEQVAEGIRTGQFGRLRVTAQSALEVGLVPSALTRFAASHPGIGVVLQIRPRSELHSWVASGHFDVGLGRMPVDDPNVVVETFGAVDACCIVPSSHPLASRDVVRAEDLQDCTFVSIARGTLLWYRVDEILSRARVRARRIEVPTSGAALQLVAAGAGVSIVHGFTRLVRNPAVAVKPFRPRIRFEYALIWPRGATPSRVARSFADKVKEAARMVSGGRSPAEPGSPLPATRLD